MSEDWKTKVSNLVAQYNATKAAHPDWPIAQIAQELNKSISTLRKTLIVFSHLSDEKVATAKTFISAYESVDATKPWQPHIIDFYAEFEKIHSVHPDWSVEEIAKSLSKSPRTVYRMLTVHKHLSDPKIRNLKTLNEAYRRIKNSIQTTTANLKDQITNHINSIIQDGETK